MIQPLKILLVEDNAEDAEIVQRLLKNTNPAYQFTLAMNKEAYLEALDHFLPDVILSDNYLPQFSATEALQIIQERSLVIPFILVTGAVSDEFAANIIKLGADDYILKDRLTRLPSALEAALKQRHIEKEKLEAVEKLIQSEEKYRTIFSKSPLPKWIYDFDTFRFLEVNEAAIKYYGYTKDEFLSKTIMDITPGEDQDRLARDLPKIKYETYTRKSNWRHLKKNGELIVVEITAHSIPYRGRKARMVIVHDVTERVKIEQEKEFASNNLAALINNTNDPMWSVDTNFRLITSNEAFSRMVEKLSGKPLRHGDLVLSPQFKENYLSRYREYYIRAFSGEGFTTVEHFNEPVLFWSEISFYPIRQGDEVIGTACFSRDITHRKKAEEELKTMEKELLTQKILEQKKVTRAIIEGQEKERNHIGKELHDNVNQMLATAKMYLSTAMANKQNIIELTQYSKDLINASINEIRALTNRYVAPLKNINLQELVNSLLKKVRENAAIDSTFTHELTGHNLNDELKLNLYRIIQENMNNTIKHAGAKHIHISINADDNFLYLMVSDDGKGFDPNIKRTGIGISNMVNRVELFNGDVKIKSAPGKGCETHIKIPHGPEGSSE
jgi:PAS domain S-box-containing protein